MSTINTQTEENSIMASDNRENSLFQRIQSYADQFSIPFQEAVEKWTKELGVKIKSPDWDARDVAYHLGVSFGSEVSLNHVMTKIEEALLRHNISPERLNAMLASLREKEQKRIETRLNTVLLGALHNPEIIASQFVEVYPDRGCDAEVLAELLAEFQEMIQRNRALDIKYLATKNHFLHFLLLKLIFYRKTTQAVLGAMLNDTTLEELPFPQFIYMLSKKLNKQGFTVNQIYQLIPGICRNQVETWCESGVDVAQNIESIIGQGDIPFDDITEYALFFVSSLEDLHYPEFMIKNMMDSLVKYRLKNTHFDIDDPMDLVADIIRTLQFTHHKDMPLFSHIVSQLPELLGFSPLNVDQIKLYLLLKFYYRKGRKVASNPAAFEAELKTLCQNAEDPLMIFEFIFSHLIRYDLSKSDIFSIMQNLFFNLVDGMDRDDPEFIDQISKFIRAFRTFDSARPLDLFNKFLEGLNACGLSEPQLVLIRRRLGVTRKDEIKEQVEKKKKHFLTESAKKLGLKNFLIANQYRQK